jgi:hypothetical protein
MGAFTSLLSGLGLSAAAGLNAFLPIFTVGLLARLGLIDLHGPFEILTHPLVLLIIAALAILDFAGDKIPAVDSVLHAVGMIVHPIAGAVLFVAANSAVGSVDPMLATLAGLTIGGGTHLLRSAARPVFTMASGGTANPVVSTLEDVAAFGLTITAILVPALAGLAVVVLMIMALRFVLRSRKVWKN